MAAIYIAQTIALDFEIIYKINIKRNNDKSSYFSIPLAFSYISRKTVTERCSRIDQLHIMSIMICCFFKKSHKIFSLTLCSS